MKIIKQLSNGFRRLTRRLGLWKSVGEKCTILEGDTFLVSYPKSGNTWLRFLIGQTIVKRPLDFYTINSVIPQVYSYTDRELLKMKRPRIIKSHSSYKSYYPKVIYIVRDPRDVAISAYFWQKKVGIFAKQGVNFSLREYLTYFVESEIDTTGSINWGKHVGSWVDRANELGNRLFILKYEDVKKDPALLVF